MIKDKRKHIRRALRYTAWIGTGESVPLRGCVVSDISQTGAKLDVEQPDELPNTFRLLLSGRGGIYRQCQVVWRSNGQIGVHFETAPAARPPRTKTDRPARA